MKFRQRFVLEALEERLVLSNSAFGNAWPDAKNLTISFVPDGTKIQKSFIDTNQGSNLFATLGTSSSQEWESEILRGFQTWAVNAGINLGVVSDSGVKIGSKFSSSGNGVDRGNIRIAAVPMSPEVICISAPYSPMSDNYSGTFLLNSNLHFSIGGSSTSYDLFSVAVHEAGNIFGLEDVADETSALFGSYTGPGRQLQTRDVTALQTLYGSARLPDAYELSGNETQPTATILSFADITSMEKLAQARGDLTTLSDVDYYKVVTSSNSTSLMVRLETTGISLLEAKISVFDANGQMVGMSASTGPLGQDIYISVPNVQSMAHYYVKVEHATGSVFGVGSYQLRIGLNVDPNTIAQTTSGPLDVRNESAGNETLATATQLDDVDGSNQSQYEVLGRLATAADTDFYKIRAPSQGQVMTICLDSVDPSFQVESVRVFDQYGNQLTGKVLVRDETRLVVEFDTFTSGQDYYVEVSSPTLHSVGDYQLSAIFHSNQCEETTLYNGGLNSLRSVSYLTLTVPESGLYHFMLDVESQASSRTGVRMAIFNSEGNVVLVLVAEPDKPYSAATILAPGVYTIRFTALSAMGIIPPMEYRLQGLILSDPIDAFPITPGEDTPPPPPPPPSGGGSTIGTPEFNITINDDPYYILLQLLDPTSDPWSTVIS